MSSAHYIIQGGAPGRERLRLLGNVLNGGSLALLLKAGLAPGMRCLDAGCGGGDLTREMAAAVAPGGDVTGLDLDHEKIAIAREEAADLAIANVTYDAADVVAGPLEGTYDLIYARFLLTHLAEPGRAIANLRAALRPGGVFISEETDFSGSFAFPDPGPYGEYVRLYMAAARAREADPDIGRRIPALLAEAAFEDVRVSVSQPVARSGPIKLLCAVTMEMITPAVIASGLATEDEMAQHIAGLHAMAADETTLMSIPRVVQAVARRPVSG